MICPICLETTDPRRACGEVQTLPCSHRFHDACLAPWLEAHRTCPTCRAPTDGGPDAEAALASEGESEAGNAEDVVRRAEAEVRRSVYNMYALNTIFCFMVSLLEASPVVMVLAIASGTARATPLIAVPASVIQAKVSLFTTANFLHEVTAAAEDAEADEEGNGSPASGGEVAFVTSWIFCVLVSSFLQVVLTITCARGWHSCLFRAGIDGRG